MAESYARDCGADTICLNSVPDAYRFYTRHGFVPDEVGGLHPQPHRNPGHEALCGSGDAARRRFRRGPPPSPRSCKPLPDGHGHGGATRSAMLPARRALPVPAGAAPIRGAGRPAAPGRETGRLRCRCRVAVAVQQRVRGVLPPLPMPRSTGPAGANAGTGRRSPAASRSPPPASRPPARARLRQPGMRQVSQQHVVCPALRRIGAQHEPATPAAAEGAAGHGVHHLARDRGQHRGFPPARSGRCPDGWCSLPAGSGPATDGRGPRASRPSNDPPPAAAPPRSSSGRRTKDRSAG